jgi:hypothetical protein
VISLARSRAWLGLGRAGPWAGDAPRLGPVARHAFGRLLKATIDRLIDLRSWRHCLLA